MPPQPGSAGQKRHSQWWRFSSGVGAANCLTRTWRGSSGASRRLIAPPLPDASQPSNTTHSGGPSCRRRSGPPSMQPQREQPVLGRLEPLGLLLAAQPAATGPAHRARPRGKPTMAGPWLRSVPLPAKPDFPKLEEEVLERWRERDVFRESVRRRAGRRAVRVLRGPADRQRAARLPPRARARVQGHLPALPDHARPLRRAQGRLGLPRPAGRDRRRAEARLQVQGRHRALRHRRVQRQVPRVGVRVPRGLGPR